MRKEIKIEMSMKSPFVFALCALAFLAGSCKEEGGVKPFSEDANVITTLSGLKYTVLQEGTEETRPFITDTVTIHYTGWLEDGTVFESTEKRGIPARFKLSTVIPGWSEGIQAMTPGARYKFIVPPNLAYGERGRLPLIPPNATLIFEVKLLRIKKGPALPQFREGNPEAQKTTESGLIYEVISPGTGEAPQDGDFVEVKYAFWNIQGQLLGCTELREGTFKFTLGKAKREILNEGVRMLREGACYRFEVSPELAYEKKEGQGTDLTVWEIELAKILKPLPVPPFTKPAPEKTKETASGLKYEVVREGTGESPLVGDTVTIHFAGWLEDGTLFDNTFEKGEPATFRLERLLPGWKEGFQLMKEGAVYRLILPPRLGYGNRGKPPEVPPKATLIFHMELIKVGK